MAMTLPLSPSSENVNASPVSPAGAAAGAASVNNGSASPNGNNNNNVKTEQQQKTENKIGNESSSKDSTTSKDASDSAKDAQAKDAAAAKETTTTTTAKEAATAGTASAGASGAVKRKPSRRANTAERRATHNAVERQRRETLNGRFLDLAALLPNLSQIRRPSKSSIVNSSIAHIHASRRHRLMASQQLRALKAEADALRRELNEWRDRAGIPRVEEPVRNEQFGMVISGELELVVGNVGGEDEDDGMDEDGPLGGEGGDEGENAAGGGKGQGLRQTYNLSMEGVEDDFGAPLAGAYGGSSTAGAGAGAHSHHHHHSLLPPPPMSMSMSSHHGPAPGHHGMGHHGHHQHQQQQQQQQQHHLMYPSSSSHHPSHSHHSSMSGYGGHHHHAGAPPPPPPPHHQAQYGHYASGGYPDTSGMGMFAHGMGGGGSRPGTGVSS
ncbi:hypothetical protein D9613_012498 [Agrocybe pediades]|uniref:BHLH domain-containing protein n=1 Tax=Agrocybe pediades TaxID=84607 RepID=A0A8H4QR82_9AGAR|nr:hypothetical protein D9613_012498 [Agrocybe pediades]